MEIYEGKYQLDNANICGYASVRMSSLPVDSNKLNMWTSRIRYECYTIERHLLVFKFISSKSYIMTKRIYVLMLNENEYHICDG